MNNRWVKRMEIGFALLFLMLAECVKSVSAAGPLAMIQTLLMAMEKRPWLLGVYVIAVGLPAILFISFMWPDKRFGPPNQPYYYKKCDDPQPDDPESTPRQKNIKEMDAMSRKEATVTSRRKLTQTKHN